MKEKQLEADSRINHMLSITFFIFVILHIVFAVYLGVQKINYHYDERLTFSLANTAMGGLKIEDGKLYHGFSLYNTYLSVAPEERFDYKGVWKNQAKDVHPPFYYVIIHTICSFFPEQYSKWFGIIPNIVFMVLADFLFFKIAQLTLKNDWLALITAVAAGTSMLNMNMVIFIRMYGMMTVFVAGVSFLFAYYFNKNKDRKFYVLCYLLAVGGTMTQYYFLIYLFFLCAIFGIRLVLQKKWNEIVRFIAAFFVAGVSCVLIFPAMLKQIFGGVKRGKQAFKAIKTLKNYGDYLKQYYEIINSNIFGGLVVCLLILFIVLSILVIRRKGWKKCIQRLDNAMVMFFLAGMLYVVLIAKIAPYRTDRYVMPVGWIFILFMVWFLYKTFSIVVKTTNKRWITVSIFVILFLLTVNSLRISGGQYHYDYPKSRSKFDLVEKYKDCSVVYVYKVRSRTSCNADELKEYKDYVFIKPSNLEKFMTEMDMNRIIVYVADKYDSNEIIDTILQANEGLSEASFLFKSSYANVYYIE